MCKKVLSAIAALLFSAVLSAASVSPTKLADPFPSRENLLKFDFSADDPEAFYDDLEISLVTTGAGDETYALFGHTSLELEYPGTSGRFYDYGFFTFSDGFYLDFALGKLYYNVYRTDAEMRIAGFMAEDRTVERTVLPLGPAEKKGIMEFLDYNVLPENNTYLYDYYEDNCATRVRDIIDEATGGEFKAWSEKIPTGESFRSSSNRSMQSQFLPAFAINYLEGPSVDRPLSRWELMYLPDELRKGVEDFFGTSSETVYGSLSRQPYNGPSIFAETVLLTVVVFIFLLSTGNCGNRTVGLISDIVSGCIYGILALMSCVLLFMMCFTNHEVTYMNENILFLNPVLFIFAYDAFRGKRHERRGRLSLVLICIIAVLAILKGLLPEVFIQDNTVHMLFMSGICLAEIILSRSSSPRPRREPRRGDGDR